MSIQAANRDMDMDTETLSTRDSSSANEDAMAVEGDDAGANQIRIVASRTRGAPRTRGEREWEIKGVRGKTTDPLRRSNTHSA